MKIRHSTRVAALVVGALAVMAVSSWAVRAQSIAKRPLTYDVYESWKTIAGARLSDDGQWFAYAVTSLADDPELIVRNLQSGKEFHHPRGTSLTGNQCCAVTFTPDSKFVMFTIVPPKSDADQNAAAGGAEEARRRRTATRSASCRCRADKSQRSIRSPASDCRPNRQSGSRCKRAAPVAAVVGATAAVAAAELVAVAADARAAAVVARRRPQPVRPRRAPRHPRGRRRRPVAARARPRLRRRRSRPATI
jgi:hypothetical protein